MDLKLYDTLTRAKRVFTPIDPAHVRMYVCGPTVYDFAHIGNARPVIVFDVLFRLLRHIYRDEHVTYVRNITDVDDKINARAAERGIPIRELTDQTYKNFKADVEALGCLPPTVEPRATEHIDEMKTLIERLVKSGNAYVAEEHVLFNVPSMPDYGKLSGRPLDEMIAGARVEVAPYKKDPQDFVLWKPSKAGEPGWPSPAGIKTPGRPGWHIECSAMADYWLWTKAEPNLSAAGRAHPHQFDIHGGGIDLVFPHHENEIAQSRCAFQSGVMANYWMHNGFLQVEGEKMAKSAGNFVTIHELLENWKGTGWPGETLRFNMLRTHYRQPIDWTKEGLEESHKILSDWYSELGGLQNDRRIPANALKWLCDDLNTAQLITELHGLRKKKQFQSLLNVLNLLGLSGNTSNLGRHFHVSISEAVTASDAVTVSSSGHYSVIGNPARMFVTRGDGTIEFDSETQKEVDALVAARAEARERKDFAESDRIRGKLKAMGIDVEDTKDGQTKLKAAR